MDKHTLSLFNGVSVTVSVRNLVQFLYCRGGLTRTSFMAQRALEGARAHRKLQKQRSSDYMPEVALKHTYLQDGVCLTVSGRADGIVENPGGTPLIEEIKTHWGRKPDEAGAVDLAQARIYAAMYLNRVRETLRNSGSEPYNENKDDAPETPEFCTIRMTYYDLIEEAETCFDSVHFAMDLDRFLAFSVERYARWYQTHFHRLNTRNQTLVELEFPFEYRRGQREMAARAYLAGRNRGTCFLMAPTGMGKTLGMLFSTLKVLGEGRGERIFYVTAKTTGKAGVAQGAAMLQRSGARFSWLVLTAKERICLQPDLFCRFDQCPYALHFYDHLDACLRESLTIEALDRTAIETLARKHSVCPYYLSRELVPWVDLVIGDFNHAFDPGSRLAGLMEKEMNTVLLVDEAHNLPGRARSMYSSSCGKKEFLAFRRKMTPAGEDSQGSGIGFRAMGKALWRLNQVFLCQLREMEHSGQLLRQEPDVPEDLDRALKECFKEAERCLALEAKRGGNGDREDEMSSLYFLLWELKQCFEAMDDSYRMLWERIGTDLKFHLLCVHPGRKLTEMTGNMVARVFFSATLHPIDFYRRELGGLESQPALSFPSPFPRANFLLLVAPFINTRHRFRAQSLSRLNEVITRALEGKIGNYLVFFPSFEYLNQSWDHMEDRGEFWFKQERNWSEEERSTFLSHFQERPRKTHVGYCVLGGIFSEGIDLLGGRLDGAVIVGVGWPPRSIQAELIKEYYDTQSECTGSDGREFAYLFPGWGRVLQASGRVIRSVDDRGFVVLAGDRFSSDEYRHLFPDHWIPPVIASSSEEVKKLISHFWS